jgi:ABC-type multidrug transport system ATPase subunit
MSEGHAVVTADENTILDVNRLTIRFGPATILKDVTFRVSRGESVAVIGPNGSGKTVLFRALIGAIPSEGTMKWRPASDSDTCRRSSIWLATCQSPVSIFCGPEEPLARPTQP